MLWGKKKKQSLEALPSPQSVLRSYEALRATVSSEMALKALAERPIFERKNPDIRELPEDWFIVEYATDHEKADFTSLELMVLYAALIGAMVLPAFRSDHRFFGPLFMNLGFVIVVGLFYEIGPRRKRRIAKREERLRTAVRVWRDVEAAMNGGSWANDAKKGPIFDVPPQS